MKYKVRFGIFKNPMLIFNFRGPMEGMHPYPPPNSVEEELELFKQSDTVMREQNRRSRNFYTRLFSSIEEEGFRNPIVVHCGWAPEKVRKFMPKRHFIRKDTQLACFQSGCKRLWYAQRESMEIPCLINDFNNAFPHLDEITTVEEIEGLFEDKPKSIRFHKSGVVIDDHPPGGEIL